MPRPLHLATLRRPQVLALLAGVCIALGAQLAQASCGDYLMDVHSAMQGDAGSTPHAPALPCHGPTCRQTPSRMPLPLPQQRVIVPTQDLAILDVAPAAADGRTGWVAADHSSTLPAAPAARLFRPPRCA